MYKYQIKHKTLRTLLLRLDIATAFALLTNDIINFNLLNAYFAIFMQDSLIHIIFITVVKICIVECLHVFYKTV